MIVVDTSAAIELALRTPLVDTLEVRLVDGGEEIHVPHLYDLEVAHVLRRLVQLRQLSARRAAEALQDAGLVPHERHGDAAFVALAEALGATLVTCDGKLARTRGDDARIDLVRA